MGYVPTILNILILGGNYVKGTLYVITNKVNGMQYIGKTYRSADERFKEHIKDSKRERNKTRKLYQAMNEFGIDNFYIVEIGQYEESELEHKEIEYIYYYDTYRNGYNETLGGDGKRYIDAPDEEFVKLYHELGTIKKVAEATGHDVGWIGRILKNCGVQNTYDHGKTPVLIQETGQTFDSVTECATYLIQANKTQSSNLFQVKKCISRVLTGKRKSYLKMTFKYV